jgi:hypothetical protein
MWYQPSNNSASYDVDQQRDIHFVFYVQRISPLINGEICVQYICESIVFLSYKVRIFRIPCKILKISKISKIHNVLEIKLIFLKLRIFTNFNTAFSVFVFEEFSEGVLHAWPLAYLVQLRTKILRQCLEA